MKELQKKMKDKNKTTEEQNLKAKQDVLNKILK